MVSVFKRKEVILLRAVLGNNCAIELPRGSFVLACKGRPKNTFIKHLMGQREIDFQGRGAHPSEHPLGCRSVDQQVWDRAQLEQQSARGKLCTSALSCKPCRTVPVVQCQVDQPLVLDGIAVDRQLVSQGWKVTQIH